MRKTFLIGMSLVLITVVACAGGEEAPPSRPNYLDLKGEVDNPVTVTINDRDGELIVSTKLIIKDSPELRVLEGQTHLITFYDNRARDALPLEEGDTNPNSSAGNQGKHRDNCWS